ncbi:unconventional myosin-XVIIIa isoform X2 [Atheta coriaria]|uniref:unconventional myosin-XVIIIa isoform X2 n=1 Tax=Dalotia coriaria TaxID=877792 RepID=UPI0031F41B56
MPPIAKPRNNAKSVLKKKIKPEVGKNDKVFMKNDKVEKSTKVTSIVKKFDSKVSHKNKPEVIVPRGNINNNKLDDCIVSCNELIEKINSMSNKSANKMVESKPEKPVAKVKQVIKTFENQNNGNNTFGERKKLREPKFAIVARENKMAAIKDQVQSARDIVKTLKATRNVNNTNNVDNNLIVNRVKSAENTKPEVEVKKPFTKSDSGIALNETDAEIIPENIKYRTIKINKNAKPEVEDKLGDDDDSDDSGHLSNDPELEQVPTKIFFRGGVLSELEHQRDERMAGMVVSLQAHCRGYLARKRLAKRKLEDLAVRCLQRNVRKFLSVRDWPWWRLLVRVTPLLNVHRTEEELKLKSEELEVLKAKLEKIEAERQHLKHENDKLESKLSEMTVDLAEEHSTATLATERLDAETAERVRVEREMSETAHKNKELTQQTERLEMELLYARSDLNGIDEEDEDAEGDGIYRQRYERTVRELEFTKRRLQQQHEDDLEQLVGLKKQLEKKLTDAYEEVEEQRQVVGQWKRKVQKLNGEMSDLKHLLEEQNGRNNLLEKKQRKFDSESQLLHDELRQEKQAKDRLGREKELLSAEKFSIESQLQDVKMELEMKEEKCTALQRELDELTYGGKTEEEVALLRKQKMECERRLHDQEEELDEQAGQVQLLEQAKLKLEMSLEQMRKQSKKEAATHDEELEEVRCSAQKKVKALEAQLENEHEERTSLMREKHELERRLVAAMESTNEKACDEALVLRLKRDLKRTKVLLRDTQSQLERQKNENPGKNIIRQLRNQIDDLECARSLATKAKSTLEAELTETQNLLDDASKSKSETEEKLNSQMRERNDLQMQLEENEEELAEVLKKYKACVQQMSLDQLALQEQVSLVAELEVERNGLKEQLAEMTSKLESVESLGDASSHILVKRAELKVKELESKLELEQTTKQRQEVQVVRLKEAVDKLQSEVATARAKEQSAQDQIRKLQRSVRELRDEHNLALSREGEALLKRKELEKRCETLEGEAATARTDLRLALKRIEDLQSAIQGELDDDSIDNSDSYSSDDSVNTFLANHNSTSPSLLSSVSGIGGGSTSTSSTRKLSGGGGKDGYA